MLQQASGLFIVMPLMPAYHRGHCDLQAHATLNSLAAFPVIKGTYSVHVDRINHRQQITCKGARRKQHHLCEDYTRRTTTGKRGNTDK